MIIALANQKGGVGKTTATFNLAMAIGRLGRKVLIVDNDPQGNLTSYALGGSATSGRTLDEVYLDKRHEGVDMRDLTQINDSLWLLASDPMLSGVEYYLVSKPNKESILADALKGVSSYFDYILIDNPPSLNLLTLNGLVASTDIVVPVQPEFFSLEGLRLLQGTITDLQKWHSNIRLSGLFVSMYNSRRKLNAEVLAAVMEAYPDKVFSTRIHNSVKVAESSGFGKSVLDYAPRSKSAEEFMSLAREMVGEQVPEASK